MADIQQHEVKLEQVVANQEKLHDLTGSEPSDATSQLKAELADLKQQALDKQKLLEKAVAEQEVNATEAERLQQEAEEAQAQLEVSMIEAQGAEQLKQELAKQKVGSFFLRLFNVFEFSFLILQLMHF